MKVRLNMLTILLAAALCSCQRNSYKAEVTDFKLVRLDPASGCSGEIIKILGRNFSEKIGGNTVTVGGLQATVLDYNRWDLTIVLPENEIGQHEVVVENDRGKAGGLFFTYEQKPDHQYITSVYAGSTSGTEDGQGSAAKFAQPEGVVATPDGGLIVLQRGASNFAIRKIDMYGNVTTLTKDAQLNYPWHGDLGADGCLYFANKGNSKILKMTPELSVTEVPISGAVLNNPMECTFGPDGSMYIANRNADEVLKVNGGTVTATYSIKMPTCISFDKQGRAIVGSNNSGYLHVIDADGNITQVAGNGSVNSTLGNGIKGDLLDKSTVGFVGGLVCSSDGSVYFCDVTALSVRRLVPDGTGDYSKGYIETVSEGFYPSDITFDKAGSKLYVSSATGAKAHTILTIEIL